MQYILLVLCMGFILGGLFTVQSACAGNKDQCKTARFSPLPSESRPPYQTPEEVSPTIISESPVPSIEIAITPQIDTPAIATQTPTAGASGGLTDDHSPVIPTGVPATGRGN